MHWPLDVVFYEDSSHFISENAYLYLNAFCKYALAVHKKYLTAQSKKCSTKRHLMNCLLTDQLLLKLICDNIIEMNFI
ncbi:MAG: hypothetical protein IJ849_07400 [Selenomonadaceae bacterium]|nr:hypothetical protein [Selenomonadaceae bacterium]